MKRCITKSGRVRVKQVLLLLFILPLFTLEAANQRSQQQASGLNDFQLGIGNLTSFVGHVQIDEQGNTEKFDFLPYFNLGMRYDVNNWLSAFPEFMITLPESGRDSNVSRLQYFLLTSLGVPWRDFWFRLGTGLSFYRVSMGGGTQELKNGTSTTDFPNAEQSSTARNMLLTAGIEYRFSGKLENLGARAETFIYNIADDPSRTVSYTLSVHYHFGSFNWGNIIQ